MENLIQQYIDQCSRIGLLTSKKVRKYFLRPSSLAVVLKTYALHTKTPFEINLFNLDLYNDYKLYLTDEGLTWLLNEFKSYTLLFLKSIFNYIFFDLKDIKDIDTHDGLNNFKGIIGINYKAGTLNKAILIRKVNASLTEYKFDNLIEARKEVLSLSRFYPIEQFTLYRTGETAKGVYYKQKVPLILGSNRRGMAINLPHLKGKV